MRRVAGLGQDARPGGTALIRSSWAVPCGSLVALVVAFGVEAADPQSASRPSPEADLSLIEWPETSRIACQASDLWYGAAYGRSGLWLVCDRNGGESAARILFIADKDLTTARSGRVRATDAFRVIPPAEGWDGFRRQYPDAMKERLSRLQKQIESSGSGGEHPLDLEGITAGRALGSDEEFLFVLAEQPDSLILEVRLGGWGEDGTASLVACYAYDEAADERGGDSNDGLEGIAWTGRPGEFFLAEEGTARHDAGNGVLFFARPRIVLATLKGGRVEVANVWSRKATASLWALQGGGSHTANALCLADSRTLLTVDRNAGKVFAIDTATGEARLWLDYNATGGPRLRERLATFPARRAMPYISMEGLARDARGDWWLIDDPAMPEGFRESALVRLSRGGSPATRQAQPTDGR